MKKVAIFSDWIWVNKLAGIRIIQVMKDKECLRSEYGNGELNHWENMFMIT